MIFFLLLSCKHSESSLQQLMSKTDERVLYSGLLSENEDLRIAAYSTIFEWGTEDEKKSFISLGLQDSSFNIRWIVERNLDIDDTEFHQLKTELERALLQDVDTTTASPQPKREQKPSKLLPYSLSALMCIGCISFYLYLGQGASFKASGEMLEPESSQAVKGVIAYVEELRAKLEKNPQDEDAWTQLGQRSPAFSIVS